MKNENIRTRQHNKPQTEQKTKPNKKPNQPEEKHTHPTGPTTNDQKQNIQKGERGGNKKATQSQKLSFHAISGAKIGPGETHIDSTVIYYRILLYSYPDKLYVFGTQSSVPWHMRVQQAFKNSMIHGFSNSYYVSHFAAFFIHTRTKISTARNFDMFLFFYIFFFLFIE